MGDVERDKCEIIRESWILRPLPVAFVFDLFAGLAAPLLSDITIAHRLNLQHGNRLHVWGMMCALNIFASCLAVLELAPARPAEPSPAIQLQQQRNGI
jgi:predicted naringenin-chalcone synthase